MNKEKFKVPMPDDRTIHSQAEQIVAKGLQRKPSFPIYLKTMGRQIGMRHLFADRIELGLLLLAAIALFSILLIPARTPSEGMYASIFLLSPIVFLAFSLYTYVNKVERDTYEVEMSCKFNVYQVIAFRMLLFSVVSILVNTVLIALIACVHEDISFSRALMISLTALFLFSILFLYALMRRRSLVMVTMMVAGWLAGNGLLHYGARESYGALLMQLPLFVYALVLVGSAILYWKTLKQLLDFRQMKGAF